MRGEPAPVGTSKGVGKLALNMEKTLDEGKRRFPWGTVGIIAAVLGAVFFFARK